MATETLIHADIFFIVTTIAVAIVGLVALIALIYIIKLVKQTLYFTRSIQRESEYIFDDIDTLRYRIHSESFVSIIFDIGRGLFRYFIRRV